MTTKHIHFEPEFPLANSEELKELIELLETNWKKDRSISLDEAINPKILVFESHVDLDFDLLGEKYSFHIWLRKEKKETK